MSQSLRIVWTVLALVAAPYAGVVYWLIHCRTPPAAGV
jgi:hypothetical protein